ncbi:two component regulator three y domain-containing protein [Nitritalea halalkaliphila LW7]|uniref:Two component regulator three y domain-containing protein n=1 Tax=Nitritalea halalkaliphila LW7 TaxID=1189621 RepID=I5C0V2_9BACT|nr:hypothetical protein [Nitritalea halalkaliphila]EIM75454.1 two component regulator three y domain-containing protein [Nitritalea halalkaliphila LW7]
MKQSLFLLFFLFMSFFPLSGKGQSFHFNRQLKGVELPTDHVYEVVQDDQGLIWMHTNAGVFYSDGFRTYAHETEGEVSSRKLLQDEENVLWLVERGERFQLQYLKNGAWYPVHIPDEIEKELLSGYASFKVSGVGAAKRLILHSEATLNIAKIGGQRWERFAKPKATVGELKSVYCYQNKLALFFEHAIFDFQSQKLTQHTLSSPLLPASVYQMDYDESTGKFYYLGNGFLAEGSAFLHVDRLLSRDFTRNTYSEKEYFGLRADKGKVFFFFNSQLHQFIAEKEELIHVDATDFIKAYHIFDFLVDRESIIWIATHRGLVNINSLRFQNYTSGYFPDDEVTALHQLPDGDLLVGFNHAVVRWDMEQEPRALVLRGSGLQPKYRVTNFSAWQDAGVIFPRDKGGSAIWIWEVDGSS